MNDGATGTTPADWIGERVRALMDTDEEVEGTLQGVTECGVVIYQGSERRGEEGRAITRGRTSGGCTLLAGREKISIVW